MKDAHNQPLFVDDCAMLEVHGKVIGVRRDGKVLFRITENREDIDVEIPAKWLQRCPVNTVTP